MASAPTRKRIFDLTGEANYQHALARATPGDSVMLVRDPGNQFDANAIFAATTSGQKLGYLSRVDAANLASSMSQRHVAKIHQLTGGMADYPFIGCRVSIAWGDMAAHPHKGLDQQQMTSGKFAVAKTAPSQPGGFFSGIVKGLFGGSK